MPLTRIDLPKGKPAEYRSELREIVYETLVETVGVPVNDRHEVVSEHDAENLYLDPNFRDLERSPEAILIRSRSMRAARSSRSRPSTPRSSRACTSGSASARRT